VSAHEAGVVVAVLLPIVSLGLIVWMLFFVRPRQRRYYTSHPERRPYGWRLLFRMSPFIAIVAVAFVAGVVTRSATSIILGAVGTLAFAVSLRQRWDRPGA
jgi:hypothetical protein